MLYTTTSSHTPTGLPGKNLSVLRVVCPLVIPRGLLGKNLSALHVVCPLVFPRGLPEEDLSALHVVCPLVIPRGLPKEDLSVCLSPPSVLLFSGTLTLDFDPPAVSPLCLYSSQHVARHITLPHPHCFWLYLYINHCPPIYILCCTYTV